MTDSEKKAVAFGRFDGMHLGHAAVLDRLCSLGASARVILLNESGPTLYTDEEKRILLGNYKIRDVLSLDESEYSSLSLEAFAKRYLSDASSVVVGEGFLYKNSEGESVLKTVGKSLGFVTVTVPAVFVADEKVSGDMIKAAFAAGDFKKAKELLAVPYMMKGVVVHGKGLGAKHGMPTANLRTPPQKLLPPGGVYATRAVVDGAEYRALTSVGSRPSVDESNKVSVETYMLDFSGDVYGDSLLLYFQDYIRPNIRFDGGIEAVRQQIEKDLKYAYGE